MSLNIRLSLSKRMWVEWRVRAMQRWLRRVWCWAWRGHVWQGISVTGLRGGEVRTFPAWRCPYCDAYHEGKHHEL